MKKGKKPVSFTDNLGNVAEKYGDLISRLMSDISANKFDLNNQFAYSYIVREYFSKEKSKLANYMYKEDDGPAVEKLVGNKIQTANAIIMYLKGKHKKDESLSVPISG